MLPHYRQVKVDAPPSGWHCGLRDSRAFETRVKWGQAGWGLAGRIHRDLAAEEAESANAGPCRIQGRRAGSAEGARRGYHRHRARGAASAT